MSWRDKALQDHARELTTWWDQVSSEPALEDDDFDAQDRTNYLEAARHYDPSAQLGEELHVRLAGKSAQGALDFDLGRSLFKPLQDGISATADSHVRMQLVGVLRGSTILVARPQETPPVASGTLAAADTSAADKGVREWLRVLDTAESQGDLRGWPRAFDPLGKLVKVLDEHSLDLGLTWHALSGHTRRVRLTARGRTYVNGLRESESDIEEKLVSGRVTELRSAGQVKLKTAPQKTATAYNVHFDEPDDLLALHLELGQSVSMTVREETTRDGVGNVLDTVHTYVRLESRQGSLDDLVSDAGSF